MALELHRPRSILFPVDFSLSAQFAAGCVRMLSGRFNSAVTLLHVLEAVTEPFEMLRDSMTERRSRKEVAEAELQKFAEEQLGSVHPTLVVREGEPADVITSAAEGVSDGMLVMPTRGKGRFRRFLLGSTTAKILNDVPLPVLTTAHSADADQVCPPGEVKSIICALALDDKSAATFRAATLVAREYGASLTAVHALENRHDRDWAQSAFDKLSAPAGVHTHFQVETGSPVTAVCKLARESGADLVVIGRSVPGPLGRLRAQSYEIIRESPVPVLSV